MAGRSDEERAKCDSTLLLPTFSEAAAVREGGEGGVQHDARGGSTSRTQPWKPGGQESGKNPWVGPIVHEVSDSFF